MPETVTAARSFGPAGAIRACGGPAFMSGLRDALAGLKIRLAIPRQRCIIADGSAGNQPIPKSMKTTFSKPLRPLSTFVSRFGPARRRRAAERRFIPNMTLVGATPQFGVHSDLGITNQIQCCTNLSQPNWVVLTNLVVTESPYWFVDAAAPPVSQRFYRVAALAGSTPPPAGMVLIPAGSFTMGNCMDPGEGYSDELPLHTVYVSAFYMDRYEVTKALWDEVKAWNGGNGYSYENAGSGKAANHPVQTVNWYDCVKWCNARSEKEGLTPCYYTEAG